jgi:hypothetical protein
VAPRLLKTLSQRAYCHRLSVDSKGSNQQACHNVDLPL